MDTCTQITLAQRLDIAQARALQQELVQAFTSGARVELDGSGVMRADTAGLQLLLVFMHSMGVAGKPVVWLSASAALQDAACLAGMADQLGLGVFEGKGNENGSQHGDNSCGG